MKMFNKYLGACLLLPASYLASGLQYALYAPNRSPSFLWAIYHVHSTMSDGLQPIEEIARQAHVAGVSVVLLTDHSDTSLIRNTFRSVIGGVVVVGGSEVHLPDGRLTWFGISHPVEARLSTFPPTAMAEVRRRGGFPVLAYPSDPRYGWQYWKADLNPSGIEILNLFTSLRRASFSDKLGLTLYYPFSHYYFLRSISYEQESIAAWDSLLRTRKTWGLIAADAHGGFHTRYLSATVPSYRDVFSLVGLGIDKRYANDPEIAIRRGDFFNCIRGAGEPDSFEFYATSTSVEFHSGSTAPAGSAIHLHVDLRGQVVRLVLKKDEVILREVVGSTIDIACAGTGVYRAEAYLEGHTFLRPDVAWIVSNPIFIGNRFTESSAAPAP